MPVIFLFIFHYYFFLLFAGWGYPASGLNQIRAMCDMDGQWNFTGVQNCLSKLLTYYVKGLKKKFSFPHQHWAAMPLVVKNWQANRSIHLFYLET